MFGIFQPQSGQVYESWNQRVPVAEQASKKAAQGLSANMATFVWNAHILIHIDCFQNRKTISGEYYNNLLDRFNDNLIKNDRPSP